MTHGDLLSGMLGILLGMALVVAVFALIAWRSR